MNTTETKKPSYNQYLKKYNLDRDFFNPCLYLMDYLLNHRDNKKPLLSETKCESVNTLPVRLNALSPLTHINLAYIEVTEQLSADFEWFEEKISDIQKLNWKDIGFISVLLTTLAVARKISSVEEAADERIIVKLSDGELKEVQKEVHVNMAHAAHMVVSGVSFAVENKGSDLAKVKSHLARLRLEKSEYLDALNRSYPNDAILHALTISNAIICCLEDM